MKLSTVLLTCLLSTATSANGVEQPAADNTDRNDRDRSGSTLTPMDQSNAQGDIDLAAAVRRAIVEEDRISTTGKNVKVIAKDGEVTLRGPVESEDEKAHIAETVRAVPGVTTLDDQLEVMR